MTNHSDMLGRESEDPHVTSCDDLVVDRYVQLVILTSWYRFGMVNKAPGAVL